MKKGAIIIYEKPAVIFIYPPPLSTRKLHTKQLNYFFGNLDSFPIGSFYDCIALPEFENVQYILFITRASRKSSTEPIHLPTFLKHCCAVLLFFGFVGYPFLSAAAPTEAEPVDTILDATVTENYSLANVNSLKGSLATGLFFATAGNNQLINLEAISKVAGSGLSSTKKGVSRVGLFTATNINTASGPTIQTINLKADSLSSSNGTVFSSTSYEGSYESKKITEQHINLSVDSISAGSGTLPGVSFNTQALYHTSAAFYAYDARQLIKGNVGKITTSHLGSGIGLGVFNSANSKAQFAEQIFEGKIGQIGTEAAPFWIGVFAQRGGTQTVDTIGSIYGTYAGIATGLNDVRSSVQEIRSVDKIIVKNTEVRNFFAYGIENWSQVGNWDFYGSQIVGVTDSISVTSQFGQAIAIHNKGGKQTIRSLSPYKEEEGKLGVKISSTAKQLPAGLRVRPLLYDDNFYTESVTTLEGAFNFVNNSLQVFAPINATSGKPVSYGSSELWLKPNEFGSTLTLAEGQGIIVQPGSNLSAENNKDNTRLRLGHGADPYTIRFTNSNKIQDLGMFSGNGVIRFEAAYLSKKHVDEANKPNIKDPNEEDPKDPGDDSGEDPKQPDNPDTPNPDEPNPAPETPSSRMTSFGNTSETTLNLAVNYSVLRRAVDGTGDSGDSGDSGTTDPTDPTNPTDPSEGDDKEPETPQPYNDYKYPYGINGPYAKYWAVGGKTGQAPYVFLNHIDTADGNPIAADRSNASKLDLVVKAYVYENGKNTGVLINSDNLCSGGKCEGESHYPGYPGARDDAKLANIFWLLRSAANSIFANEGIENMGSQGAIMIKDDYKEGYFGLSQGTTWHKLTDEDGNELKDDNGDPIIRRWDPKDPNAQFAKAAGWVYLPEGVVNEAYRAQWYFEDVSLVGETATDLAEYTTLGVPADVKYRGEIIDLTPAIPWKPLEPGFTHPIPLIPATPIPQPKPKPTPTMKSIESVSLSHYFTWRQEIDTLHQRLGEVRDNNELEGLWARGYAGRNRFSHNGYSFKDNYRGIQIGLDRNYYEFSDKYRCREKDGENFPCKREKSIEWMYGTGLSYTEGDLKLSRGGTADNWMASWWLYGVRKFSNGGYLDLVGKVSRFSNKFSAWSSDRLLNTKGRDHTWGYTLSTEYGNKHYIRDKKDWYLDPQLQIVYGRIFGSSFRTNNQVNVKHKAVNSLIGRVGVALGYEAKKGSAFVKVDGLREFAGKLDTTYKLDDGTSNRSRFNLKETWGEVSAGGTYTFSEKKDKFAHFYVKRSFASKLKTDYRVDIGFEYLF